MWNQHADNAAGERDERVVSKQVRGYHTGREEERETDMQRCKADEREREREREGEMERCNEDWRRRDVLRVECPALYAPPSTCQSVAHVCQFLRLHSLRCFDASSSINSAES